MKKKISVLISSLLVLGVLISIWLVGRICKKRYFPKKFNTIVIGIDTCRKSHMSCYGYHLRTTPHLEEFARDSIIFTNAVTQSPWTLPAFATFLTSTYPSVHGATGKAERGRYYSMREGLPSGVEVMFRLGIATKAFVNGPFLAPAFGFSRGFLDYDYAHGNNFRIRRANETINQAISWIQGNPRDRFFLFIHLFDPHMNYDPPRAYEKRLMRMANFSYQGPLQAPFSMLTEVREGQITLSPEDWTFVQLLYDAEIAYVDEYCGKLFDFLKEKRLYDRTLIIVLSDHGEEFMDHGGFEHGHTQYDELLEIPLIMKLPSNVKAGKTISSQVGLIDIMPTLLDALSADTPESFQGKSFLRWILEDGVEEEISAFSEETHRGEELKAVRSDRFKLIANPAFEKQELYDLSADPQEKRNLIETDPRVAARMRETLLSWMKFNSECTERMKKANLIQLDQKTIDNLKSLGYIK
ncbi:MAG: sulfatase [Candidatus Aminicenantales bacterium]